MNRRNNRQYRGSAERMEGAMLELMNAMPFEKITVRLICQRAGVNRSTFYAHYEDIYAMIRQMEEKLREGLMACYSHPGETEPLSRESFLPFLGFLRAHQSFYRVALKTRREFPLRQGYVPLWEQLIRPLCLRAGITEEAEMLYYWVGFQAGFTMVVRRWVEQGCLEQEEQMARVLRDLVPSVWR